MKKKDDFHKKCSDYDRHGKLTCPYCGEKYKPIDYNDICSAYLCSNCGAPYFSHTVSEPGKVLFTTLSKKDIFIMCTLGKLILREEIK